MSDMPAFPVTSSGLSCTGMTLRDYFAAQAIHAVLRDWERDRKDGKLGDAAFDEDVWAMARDCYHMADAMLLAREGVR